MAARKGRKKASSKGDRGATDAGRDSLDAREGALRAALARMDRVRIALSGGTDSALLLFEAVAALGPERVTAVTVTAPIFPKVESDRARALCRRLKVRHVETPLSPLGLREFRENRPDRCYRCKRMLFETLKDQAREEGATVLDGSQRDDLKDYRPGARALAELGIESPLRDAGLGKDDIRRLSRRHGLATADLPAMACLASRVPFGTAIDEALLSRIESGEDAIRRLGFRRFRLRHHGEVARLEFDPGELPKAFRFRKSLTRRIREAGWTYVCLDLAGYRTGSLNESLDERDRGAGKA